MKKRKKKINFSNTVRRVVAIEAPADLWMQFDALRRAEMYGTIPQAFRELMRQTVQRGKLRL